MPFARESLTQLRADAENDLRASLPGSDPLLRFSNLRILVTILAGMVNLLYGYLDWIAKQCTPFTATDEFLAAWGALKNVYLKAATTAGDRDIGGGGQVTFTGSTPNVGIPMGTPLARGDTVGFQTLADVVVANDGTAVCDVACLQVGAIGNSPVGTVLVLGTSIAGIQSNSTVTTAITGGADVEDQEDFRSRILQAFSNPPQGGSASDYETWALEVAGVTRAWCRPQAMGVGTVSVFFMMDNVEAAFGGFPQGTNGVAAAETRAAAATGDQLLVANHIFPLAPVTALVYAVAPQNQATAFTIFGTTSAGQRTAIEAAIDDVFRQTASPGGTVSILAIQAAVAAVPNLPSNVEITSPTVNITASTSTNLLTRGAMTYT